MKFLSLLSILMSLCFVSPLLADDSNAVKPPTIDPLPAGWTHDAPTEKANRGKNESLKAFFDVIAEPKSTSFDAWCKKRQEREIKDSPIYEEKDTPLKQTKIGSYTVQTYDATGTIFLLPVHARIYFVELPNSFARLNCNCGEESWSKIVDPLDDLVKNMK